MDVCESFSNKLDLGEKSKNKRHLENISTHRNKWVEIKYDVSSRITGLLLRTWRELDYCGKMTDFVVIRPIDQYTGESIYMMIDLERINTIELEKDQDYPEAPKDEKIQVLNWLNGKKVNF
jgi:hypothetical protein